MWLTSNSEQVFIGNYWRLYEGKTTGGNCLKMWVTYIENSAIWETGFVFTRLLLLLTKSKCRMSKHCRYTSLNFIDDENCLCVWELCMFRICLFFLVFIYFSIFEVIIWVTMKIVVSWYVMRFGLVNSNQTALYHIQDGSTLHLFHSWTWGVKMLIVIMNNLL